MRSRFSALLWLEELHVEKELREFNISGAVLRKGGAYLHLEVLGLAEGRPSLYIGEKALPVFIHYCNFVVFLFCNKCLFMLFLQVTE